MRYVLTAILLFLLVGCNHPETQEFDRHTGTSTYEFSSPEKEENVSGYKVTRVKDGDTFFVIIDGIEKEVRFAHIDCPEKDQPFGLTAKDYLAKLCLGKYVNLVHNNKYDRYNRLIAEVFL